MHSIELTTESVGWETGFKCTSGSQYWKEGLPWMIFLHKLYQAKNIFGYSFVSKSMQMSHSVRNKLSANILQWRKKGLGGKIPKL